MSEQSRRRGIGLDVHREFAQVAVWEGGVVTQAGRFATTPDEIRGFAADLGPADEVALEATGNTWAIAGMAAEQASILAETTKRGGGRGRQQWDATLKPVGAMQRGSTPSPCVLLFAQRSTTPTTARRYRGPRRGQGRSSSRALHLMAAAGLVAGQTRLW
jgi:hypothetical protein